MALACERSRISGRRFSLREKLRPEIPLRSLRRCMYNVEETDTTAAQSLPLLSREKRPLSSLL